MSLSVNIGRPFLNDKTLDEQARSILRKYGTDAHVYLPGASGVRVSALNTGNYTLSDGSSGLSAIDGTAGLVLDAAGSVGADLLNGIGSFDSGTGWSLTQPTSGSVSISGGALTINSVDGSWAAAAASGYPVVANSTYYYEIDATTTGGQGIRVDLGGAVGTPFTGSGVFTGYIKATNTAAPLVARGGATANSGAVVRSLVIREVTGIHASQSTTANKPAERRGLYNLLTYSNDLSNAIHAKSAVSVSGQKIVEDSTTGNHYLADTSTISAAPYTHAVRVTAAEHTRVLLRENSVTGAASTFDLANGTVLGNENGASGSIVAVGDGSYICATTRTFSAGSTQFGVFLVPNTGTNFASCSYAGNGSAGLTVNQVALFAGTLTAQQILAEGGIPLTTSAAASNSAAGRYWLDYDGGTDYLQMGSLPFVLADDFLVVCAARVDSTANSGKLFSIRGSVSNPLIELALSSGAPVAQIRDDAGTVVSRTHGATITSMSVCTMWKVGTTVYLRVNGVQSGGSISVSGLGATTLLYAAAGAALVAGSPSGWFDGAMGPMLPLKGTFAENDVLTIERWVAANTPNGPVF